MGILSSANPRILIADDQPDVVQSLRLLLENEGYQTDTATSPAEILAAIETRDFDLALIDLNYPRDTTSGEEGLDLLGRVQVLDATLPIVVMTAWGTVELAVEAMRRGARDFVQKPWDNAQLLSIVSTQVELSQALRRGQRLEAENQLLRADGDQLDQLLINLIRNAADAALESGGEVNVRWKRNRSHLEVQVEDNGPGLSTTTNLFVPFFTTKPGGSGIGLVLSRQIAEAHGGSLTLENRAGQSGCLARLRLPVQGRGTQSVIDSR